MVTFGGVSEIDLDVRLPLVGLVALAALFGQHPLPNRPVFRDARHAGFQTIAGSTGRGAVPTLRCGVTRNGLAECFVSLATFFGNHARPRRAPGWNAAQAGLEGVVRLRGGCFHRSTRRCGLRRSAAGHGFFRRTGTQQEQR